MYGVGPYDPHGWCLPPPRHSHTDTNGLDGMDWTFYGGDTPLQMIVLHPDQGSSPHDSFWSPLLIQAPAVGSYVVGYGLFLLQFKRSFWHWGICYGVR
jgi:hypothetical protein